MTPAQIAKAQTLVREWKPAPTLFDEDHPDASEIDAGRGHNSRTDTGTRERGTAQQSASMIRVSATSSPS